MIIIYHELIAEIYPVTEVSPVATQGSDCNAIAGLEPTPYKTLWCSSVVAWRYITKTLGESEFGFQFDY